MRALRCAKMTSIQTKLINVTSFAVVMTSVFAGSKVSEFIFLTETNKKLIMNINSLYSQARSRWNETNVSLKTQVIQLTESIKFNEHTENERTRQKLEDERIALQKKFENVIERKTEELDIEMNNFQSNLNEKLKFVELSLSKLENQLKDHLIGQENNEKLEHISKMIIEDKIEGKFSNCLALNTLKEEYKSLIPIARQYYSIDYNDIGLFKYYISKFVAQMMFAGVPMQRHDIMHELSLSIERGDLYRTLFLFNNLKGWPRLILKNWAEKCRLRLEFIHEIKSQIYFNKI